MSESEIQGHVWRCERHNDKAYLVRETTFFSAPLHDRILIGIQATGINRADIYQLNGRYPPPEGQRDVPGLEVSGIVERVGPNASHCVGDAVCALLPAGGYASHAYVPSSHAVHIPNRISFERAAAAPECYATAIHNIHDVAALISGQTLFIHAASGGLGAACIHTARLAGIIPYAITRDPAKIPFLLKQGAERCYLYGDDYVSAFLKDTKGRGAHAVLDTVGANTFSNSLKIAADDASIILLGFLSGAYMQTSLTRILTKRLRVIGSTIRYLSDDTKANLMRRFAEHILPEMESCQTHPVIDRMFPAHSPEAALQYMRSCAHTGKIILQA